MEITHVFAGMAVNDYDSARAWYERLFGRPPDLTPKEDEAVWQLASTGLIYIVADRARAGRGVLTLAVDDLDAHLDELAERGLAPESIEAASGSARRVVISDPDGNTITVFEDPSPRN